MTIRKFEELDTKTLAYEWIVDYPSGAYDFIFELINENKKLQDTVQLLKESNSLAASILRLKYPEK